MFTLRRADRSDAWAIHRLVWQSRINPSGLDWRRFVVAMDDRGQLIGCGQVKVHDDGSRELASVAVHPEYRRQGVATGIIEYLLRESPPPLYLTCRASLHSFYAKFGFVALSPDQMPPYFRRIWKLFGWLRRIHGRLEELLVMRWSGDWTNGV